MQTAVRGRLYYYKLEDVDVSGKVKFHGPVCVDWDGDGMPDDWEIAHGLNPGLNDAELDFDGDGVSNRLEYERGTDPWNRDSDGDGIPDGAEKKSGGQGGGDSGGVEWREGVQVISSDSEGVTLELLTPRLRAAAGAGGRGGLRAAAGGRVRARVYAGAGAAAAAGQGAFDRSAGGQAGAAEGA